MEHGSESGVLALLFVQQRSGTPVVLQELAKVIRELPIQLDGIQVDLGRERLRIRKFLLLYSY